MKKYVSIDIGGTAIKYSVLTEEAEFIHKGKMETEAWKGGPCILEKTKHIVRDYRKEMEISGICISTAGMVDTEKGEIFYSAPLIPNYAGTKFKETLEQEFHIPCEVENDVNCAGLAESISGAAKGSRVSVCLTIGTGIGGCILIDGKVFHGFSNSACEVGYMHMFDSDFQTLGATSILTQKVAEQKMEDKEQWSGYRIFEQAKKGDQTCIRAIEDMVEVLGRGIANICYVINPEVVVLGGGVMAQKEYLQSKIERSLKAHLVETLAKNTRLGFAVNQNDAGMLGAFYHFSGKQGS